MQNHIEYSQQDFDVLKVLFANPSEYIQITDNDLRLLPLYQNELELDMQNGPKLIFPFSHYYTEDSDDDEEFDSIRYEIQSLDLKKYPYGASYIDGQVYIHLHPGKLKRIIDESGNTFYLKKIEFKKYLVRPLDDINPEVYPRSYYFQEYSLIYFMRDAGINLSTFLKINIALDTHVIQIICDKIVKAVTLFHQREYIHTDIKADNLCIQFNSDYPEASQISLIDCEACQPIEDRMDFYNVPIPGTFTFYPPEIFLEHPSYVHDFNTLMLFQKLSYDLIINALNETQEITMLAEEGVDLKKVSASDLLFPLTPQTYIKKFLKAHQFGLFNVKTDLFALGCVLKEIIDYYEIEEESNPLVQQVHRLTAWEPEHRMC